MYSICFAIFMQIWAVHSAPLLPFLQPYQTALQHPQMMLQQQLMELQEQQWNRMNPVSMTSMPAPLILLLPYNQIDTHKEKHITNKRINDRLDEEFQHKHVQFHGEDEEDTNAVVIDAVPSPVEEGPHRALLLLPNARLSIGEIISSIPFLPIEINVPDTISWAYNGIANGIASIISIISPQSAQGGQSTIQLKSMLNKMDLQKASIMRPIILLPMHGPVPFYNTR